MKKKRDYIQKGKEKLIKLVKMTFAFLIALASLNLSSLFGIDDLQVSVEAATTEDIFGEDSNFLIDSIDWNNLPGSVEYLEGIGDYDAESVGQRSVVKMTQVSNGQMGAMALDANGAVWSWGYNLYGELGIGKTVSQQNYFGGMRRIPYFVDNNIFVVQIQGNYENRMALDDQGNVYTWGHGAYGQMGNGTTTGTNTTPQKVPGLPKIKQILSSSGEIMGFNYAIDEDGQIWGWGYNSFGALGTGSIATSQTTPVKISVPTGTKFVAMTAGDHQFHAIDENGDIWSAGYQYQGRLGNGQTAGYNATLTKMTKPAGMGKVVDISSCYGMNVALDENGLVWQWGAVYGMAASTGTATAISRPQVVETDSAEISKVGYTPVAQKVFAGESVSYFVDQHGRSWAWGSNRYFGLGREGGYETANDIQLTKAQQWPKVIGDGDTQIYDSSAKTPFTGSSRNATYGYGFNTLHPTIYDEKYKGNAKENVWRELAFKNIPYVTQIVSARSTYTLLDESGNIYKWGNDGSGSIAWGWDYNSRYDSNGSLTAGLYDRYTYEVMFMRGMPTAEPMYSTVDKTKEKIYIDEDNPKKDTVTIETHMPAKFEDASLNLSYTPELRSIKYVILPYDTDNDDFNATSISSDRFEELYASGNYTTGELLDDKILADATAKTVENTLDIYDNCKVIVMVEGYSYSQTTKEVTSYVADNFYTPVKSTHVGNGYVDGEIYENIYTATTDNVVNKDADGKVIETAGIPLDANGNVIENPTFGYDSTTITKYDELPNGEDKYWLFQTPQDATKTITLDDEKYVNDEGTYEHEFKYERNPSGWITISYQGIDVDTNQALPAFSMSPNPEIVKIDKELTRTPTSIENYDILGYRINTDTTIYDLDSSGDFIYTPTGDTDVTFLYGTWSSEGNKSVSDANNDTFASPGEELVYTLTYENEGSGAMRNMLVQDKLTEVLKYVDDPTSASVTINNNGQISTKTVQDLIDGFTIDEVKGKTTVTISFKVTVKTDIDLETVSKITNTATLGDIERGTEINVGKAELDLDKAVSDANGDGYATPGEELTYTITTTNKGPANASNLVIKDELLGVLPHVEDTSATVVTLDVNGTKTTHTIQDLVGGITVSELKATETATVTFTVTVKSDLDLDTVKEIKNQATSNDEPGPEITIPTGKANLKSAKSVEDANNDGYASPGEQLTYTITTVNNGPADATNLLVQDKLTNVLGNVNDTSATVVSVDIDGTKTNYTIQNLVDGIRIPTLESGSTLTVTFKVTVKSDLDTTTVTSIANQATIGDTDPKTEIPTAEADLSSGKSVVDESGDNIASPGEQLTYTITATNNGDADSGDVVLKDEMTNLLPHISEDAASIVVNVSSDTDASKNGTVSGSALVSGLTYKLKGNETVTLTFTVTVKSDLDTSTVTAISNQATLDGEKGPEVEIPTGKTSLSNEKSVVDANSDGYASPGEELTYTITTTNNGSVAAKNVVIKDELTDVLPHVDDPKANTVTINVGGSITTKTVQDLIDGITIDEIGAGVTVTVSFKVTVLEDLDVDTVKEIKNQATLGDEPGPEIIIPVEKANLKSAKSVTDANDDGYASPGEQLTYTIVSTNNGPADATNLLVQDKLTNVLGNVNDTSSTVVSVDIDGTKTNYTIQNLVDGIRIPTLKNGSTLTVTFKVTVKNDLDTTTVTSIANQATIGDTDPKTEIPTANADFGSGKSVVDESGDNIASPGEKLTYTITATNNGNADSGDVVLKDEMTNLLPHISEDATSIVVNVSSDTDSSKDGTVSGSALVSGLTYKLKGNETITLTFTVTVKSDLDTSTVTSISNQATLDGEKGPEVEIPTGKTNLSNNKNVVDANGDGYASPGEELTYTISTTNNGSVTAKNVVIKDELTSVLPHVDDPTANAVTVNVGGSITTKTVQDLIDGITIDEIGAGVSVTVSFKVTVKSDLDVDTVKEIKNQATLGDEPGPEIIIPVEKANLKSAKSVSDANDDGYASPGEQLSYTITTVNNGPADATNLLVQDKLTNVLGHVNDTNSTVVSVDIDGTKTNYSIQNLVDGIRIPTLKNGSTLTVTFKVTVKSDLDTTTVTSIANQATIGDTDPKTEIPTAGADFITNKSVTDESGDNIASPGEKLTYVITATNNGNADSGDVVLKDEMTNLLPHIDEDASTISVTVSSDKDSSKDGTVNGSDLVSGLTYKLKGKETVTLTFTVTVKSDLDTSTVKSISNQATLDGEKGPEVEIPTGKTSLSNEKSVVDANSDGYASPGEELTYTITTTNNGSVAAKNVVIKDELTDVLPHVDDPKANTVTVNVGGSVTTKTVQDLIDGITIDEIGAGVTVTVSFKVTVLEDLDVETVKEIKNQATLGDEPGPEIIIPVEKANLKSAKSVSDANDDGYASPGEQLSYTITTVNNGPADASNLLVQDKLTNVLGHVNDTSSTVVSVDIDGTKTNYSIQNLVDGIRIPTLESGSTLTVTFKVTVKSDLDTTTVTSIANQATIGDTEPKTEIPTADSDFTTGKSVSDESGDNIASPGEKLTYTITATNNGDADSNDVILKDEMTNLLPHIDESAASIVVNVSSDTDSSKDGTVSGSDLVSGLTYKLKGNETVTLTFAVTVKSDLDTDTVKSISNQATLDGEKGPEVEIPTGKTNLSNNKNVEDANGDGYASPGEELTYTISTTNNGGVTAKNVVIKDELTDVLLHVDDPKANTVTVNVGGSVTTKTVQDLIDGITIDEIGVGVSVTVSFKVTVLEDLDLETVKVIKNQATLGDVPGPEIEIPTGKATLSSTKSVSDASGDNIASPGEKLTYTITATNNGDAESGNVVLKDEMTNLLPHIDEAATAITVTVSSDTDASKNTTVSGDALVSGLIYKLAAGETITLTFEVTVKSDLDTTTVTSIANQATLGDTPGPEIVIPTGKTNLSNDKDVSDANNDGYASPGEELTYTISTTNNGSVTAKNVVIKDELTDVLPHVDDPKANTVSVNVGGTVTTKTVQDLIDGITIDEIGPGVTVTVSFKVTVLEDLDVDTVKEIKNQATLGDEPGPEIEIPTGKANLKSAKSVSDANDDGYASPGEQLSYTITTVNNGPADATNLLVQDKLTNVLGHVNDTSATVVSVDIDGTKTNYTIQNLVDGIRIPTLESGSTLTVTFKVTVKSDLDTTTVTSIANQATIGDTDPKVEIPTSDADFTTNKSVSDASGDNIASPGEQLTYVITATNNGDADSDDVILKDEMTNLLPHIDEAASAISVTVSSDKDSSKDGTVSGSDLVSGLTYKLKGNETITLIFTVTVKSDLDTSTVKSISNQATLDGEKGPEVEIPTGKTSLSNEKAVVDANDDGYASPGEELTYTISTTNNGSVAAKNVVIKDELTDVLPHVNDPKANTVTVNVGGSITTKTVQDLIDGITIDEIGAGVTVTVSFKVTVKSDLDVDTVKEIKNQATLGDVPGPEIEIPTGKANLTSNKTVTDASGDNVASPGEKLSYTITTTNTGPADATNLLVQDKLDNVLPHVNDTASTVVTVDIDGVKTNYTIQNLVDGITIPTLEKDSTLTITFDVTVKSDLDTSTVTSIANKATIGDTGPEITIPTGKADFVTDKDVKDASGDNIASPGEKLTYTIIATNGGDATSDDIMIKDTLDNVLPHIDEASSAISVSVTSTDTSKNTTVTGDDLISGLTYKLASKETITVTFEVTVKSDLDTSKVTAISNKATVGDTTPEITIPTGNKNLSNNKEVVDANGDGFASPGEELTYTLTTTNNGSVTAKDVVIKDELTDVLPHVNDPKANTVTVNVGGTVTTKTVQDLIDGIEIDEIGKGVTVTVSFKVTVKSDLDVETVKSIKNQATLDDIPGPEIEIPTGKATLTSDKSVSDANNDGYASPGEQLTYTITATNTGDAVSGDVVIKDEMTTLLPNIQEKAADISVTVNSNTDAAKNTTVSGTDLNSGLTYKLAANETITIQFTVTVDAYLNLTSVPSIANKATVGDTTPEITIPTGKAIINASKSVSDANGDEVASPTEVLEYTITASNSGVVASDDVVIKDTLTSVLPHIDEASSAISVNVNSNVDASKNTVVSGDALISGLTYKLAPSEVITVTFKVTVKADLDTEAVKEIMNTATVGGQNETVKIPTGKSTISSSKTVVDESGDKIASPGEKITYTITGKNTGSVVANDVQFKDELTGVLGNIQESSSAISVNVSSSTDSGKNTTITGDELINGIVYNLAASEEITITFSVTVKADLDTDAVTVLKNIATIGGTTSTVELPTGKANVISEKSVRDASGDNIASPNEVLHYSIVLNNTGAVAAENVFVQDTMSGILAHIAETPSTVSVGVKSNKDATKNTTISAQQLIDGVNYNVASGEIITITFDVTVSPDLDTEVVKELTNIAVIGDGETPPVVIPTGKADLLASKDVKDADGNGEVSAGEKLTYTITAKNQGDVALEGVTIKDTLDKVLPYIAETTDNVSVVVASDSDSSKNQTVTLAELVNGISMDIEPNETITVTFGVTMSSTLNETQTTVIANKAVVGEQTPEVEIEVAQSVYRIYYNGNGYTGSDVPVDETSYFRNDLVTIRGFMSRVYTQEKFVEWNSSPDGTGVSFNIGDTTTFAQMSNMGIVAADRSVTLYAIWEKEEVPVVTDKPVISSNPSVAPATGDLFTSYALYIGGALILFFGWSKFRFRRFHQRKK
ncbi:DUF7927 domain-containing protein [Breznakia pachnodae]|uniref:Repeat protein (TIGR01451 family) n=1 Tax=Breznakia pachnodae TaxID=265178 RepID=A0ABU0E5Q8_9FIRM|nr:hypothetical protein [Breznakia pachnodae]MDQ0361850.1 putative repeat protein (TIGR01451 family) [Breznakia pachnodae]